MKRQCLILLSIMFGLSFLYPQAPRIFQLLRENNPEKVKALLDTDPLQANASLANGFTPLMAAAGLRNLEMVRLLISRGAVVRSGDDHLRAPIHYANWYGDQAMIELLMAKGAPVDTRAIGGATPLIHSSYSDQFEMCKFLIEKGADIHIQCNALTTPLYFAVLNGNAPYADYLLATGAEVEVPDFLGRTPLTIAVRDGNRLMTEKLLKHGADLSAKERFSKRSLLHLAAIEGHEDVAVLLLNRRLPVNETDGHGLTPLDYACRYQHPVVAKILRSRGAKRGKNPKTGSEKKNLLQGVKQGNARVIKLQNGSWGVSTANMFFIFGYSEIGKAPYRKSLQNGYLDKDSLESGKKIICVDHDFHPARESYALQGSNPLYALQDRGMGLTFVLNPARKKRYASYGLKRAVFLHPDKPHDLPPCRLLALSSYRGQACYVFKTDGLTIIWLTGICDNYMVNRRNTKVIEILQQKKIKPDILLIGSPTGIGPEIAHGIRETIQAAEPLDAGAIFVFGHGLLERKVLDQLRRKGRDTSRLQCAENPGDCIFYSRKFSD